jgi:hypothetical protein
MNKKLQELHTQLQQNDRGDGNAIAGMGCIGKTELALQYASKQSTQTCLAKLSPPRVIAHILQTKHRIPFLQTDKTPETSEKSMLGERSRTLI